MTRILCFVLLLVPPIALSQQQSQRPQGPPYSTPPVAPDRNPEAQQPPDTVAPAQGELSNPELEKQLQKSFASEPMLDHVSIRASVDDKTVVLRGTVRNEEQHRLALQIAQSYAAKRQVLDNLKVRQGT